MPLRRSRSANSKSESAEWVEHTHEPMVHFHRHHHVTHNFREISGAFEHLASAHEHEHDHAAVSHSHGPHQNEEREHEHEAHVHDHDQTVKPQREAVKSTAKKAPAKKTTKPR